METPLLFFAAVATLATTAVAQVNAADDRRAAALAHLALVEQAAAKPVGPDRAPLAERIAREKAEIDRSFDWLVEKGEGALALRLAYPLGLFSKDAEGRARLERALATKGAEDDAALRVLALYRAGVFAFRMRDQPGARRLTEECLRLARRTGNERGTGLALVGLARLALRDEDHAAVRRQAGEAMTIATAQNDATDMAGARHLLAYSAAMERDLQRAETLYRENLAAHRSAGNLTGVGQESGNLAGVLRHQGKFDEARKLLADYVRIARELKHDTGALYALLGWAHLAAAEAKWERAAYLYGAAEAAFERQGTTMDPGSEKDYRELIARVQANLSPAVFAAAREKGRAETVAAALDAALEPSRT